MLRALLLDDLHAGGPRARTSGSCVRGRGGGVLALPAARGRNQRSLAMESVREALATAQEAGDGACLAHAAAWGALAGGRARRAALLLRVPRAAPAAAAAQLMAQHAAVNSAKPADVFQVRAAHLTARGARWRAGARAVPRCCCACRARRARRRRRAAHGAARRRQQRQAGRRVPGTCRAPHGAWCALAGGRARRAALLLRVPRAPRPAAAAAQLMAQHAAVNSAKPADVFQVRAAHLTARGARWRAGARAVPRCCCACRARRAPPPPPRSSWRSTPPSTAPSRRRVPGTCRAPHGAWCALAGGRARRAALLLRVPRAPRPAAAAAQLMAQHAAVNSTCRAPHGAWCALAGGRARRAALLLRVPRAPRPAAAAQLMAQHAAVNSAKPADVFQVRAAHLTARGARWRAGARAVPRCCCACRARRAPPPPPRSSWRSTPPSTAPSRPTCSRYVPRTSRRVVRAGGRARAPCRAAAARAARAAPRRRRRAAHGAARRRQQRQAGRRVPGTCRAPHGAWCALAGGRARRAALLLRVPRAPRPAAAAAQLMAQHAAVNSAKPADVFQVRAAHLTARGARWRAGARAVPRCCCACRARRAPPPPPRSSWRSTPPSTAPSRPTCSRYVPRTSRRVVRAGGRARAPCRAAAARAARAAPAAAAAQLMAQHAAVNSAKPADVFQVRAAHLTARGARWRAGARAVPRCCCACRARRAPPPPPRSSWRSTPPSTAPSRPTCSRYVPRTSRRVVRAGGRARAPCRAAVAAMTIITKGDSINYLHAMTDLTMAGLANTAALWSLYGKTEMASVACQLLLNLNTSKNGRRHFTSQNNVRKQSCLSICR
ncbi:hypothetical protein MSG28_002177 [Choristoneura fumiferana]|uniref:Uncharacterized protein n=1 Tax=Choristoneura fumiferana TaxID=7141 RepID=A0ACC0JU86_CHOFU|nr:hypothetical protein MSG28_002177 [Choristoneura fumiferana]